MKYFVVFVLILVIKSSNSLQIERSPRIFGGVDADIHEFPYLVVLIYQGTRRCGGSLINKNWVLTAAHCEYPIDDTFLIEYGSTELKISGENGKFGHPELFIKHEHFSAVTISHDIGLIKLKDSISTGFHNTFVHLPISGAIYTTGTPAVVAGWGLWSYTNDTIPPLQKLDTEVWDYKDCRMVFEEDGLPEDVLIHSTNICAAVADFSGSHCNGDSGGPLLVNGVQVGIVSWSIKPCGVEHYPGVYTAVAPYVDWISRKSGIKFDLLISMVQRS
ncbi:thrombin-like enzyme elegaxobin-2 [Chironomus tepperi]|uniref:thrombin-like enzyme elegaxobin-2 n=1 Tax=Chironomus tepperi TaxID=113505 RepID=UPI00391F25FA